MRFLKKIPAWFYLLGLGGLAVLVVGIWYIYKLNLPLIWKTPLAITHVTPLPLALEDHPPTNGPLQVSSENPRYFMERSGKTILLTGSHTWAVLVDNGGSNPPPVFDYPAWLDFLEANGHNFFRLWTWDQSRWTLETTDENYWFFPVPYLRPGPDTALDGQPRFDLNQFNQAYFDRMRERIIQARDRGIYVSIMLFDGWSNVSSKGDYHENNPWRGHPYNSNNNINGINGDSNGNNSGEEFQELNDLAMLALQEAYIQKVIDTVNDLDNVLYEISNESHSESVAWQYFMIDFVKTYEVLKPFQHPVGMTAAYPGGYNGDLFASHADWISINNSEGDYWEPREADGTKILITDTDHLCGICGDREWAWRSFTRGHNPIFMDGYDGAGYGVGGVDFVQNDLTWVNVRANLGYLLSYANRMNLAASVPQSHLCSSGYCLANLTPNQVQFIVYLPKGEEVQVNLKEVNGLLNVEWLNPETGEVFQDLAVLGGSQQSFNAPFDGDVVLYLFQK